MAGAAIIAAALTDHGARSKSLFIDGLDVLYEPTTSGMPYGVPIESIHVVESGPDGVSSMSFDIVDLASEVTIAEGQIIRFFDHDLDVPLFLGFPQSWNMQPLPVGRKISLRCVGVEAVLDWLKVPALTIPSGTNETVAIQSAYANATSIGFPLRVIVGANSSVDHPVDDSIFSTTYDVVLSGGTTFRQAIVAINAAVALPGTDRLVTVDSYAGLRYWTAGNDAAITTPTDWNSLVVIDTPTNPTATADLDFETDAGGVAHQVYVDGGNAAGTGTVTDGTGIVGDVGVISDETSLTTEQRDAIGFAYLNTLRTAIRGSLRLENHTPDLGVLSSRTRGGGRLQLIDANVGLGSTLSARVYSISKTFNKNGTENWTLAFGGHTKSAIRTTRRLTRNILS